MNPGPLILIDGACSLCSAAARFVVRHERAPLARFAALQTSTGRGVLAAHGLFPDDLDTMVFVESGQAYTRSDAVLRVARLLRAPWCWMWGLRLVPRSIRNWTYDRVARNRYRFWRKLDVCTLPLASARARFIDADEFLA